MPFPAAQMGQERPRWVWMCPDYGQAVNGPVRRSNAKFGRHGIPKIKTQFCDAENLLSPSKIVGNVLFMFSYSEKTQAQPANDPANAEEVFKLNLSDLPGWFLEASCCYSKVAGLEWFRKRCGDQKLGNFVCRLTCSHCGERPKYVHIQSAPYHQPGLTATRRLILIGSEETQWQRHARMRAIGKGKAAGGSEARPPV